MVSALPVNRAGVCGSTGIGSPSASNPWGQSRYMSDQLSASSFALFMIRFQSLACSQAAIFIDLSESFSTLLIASFLDWISLAFLFHKLQYNCSNWFFASLLVANRSPPGVLSSLVLLPAAARYVPGHAPDDDCW